MYNNAIAVTFSVDGKTISWGGDSGNTTPLAPGHTFSCTGDGHLKTWNAVEGNHILMARIDDINRLPSERNKMNNCRSRTLTVGDYRGKLDMISQVADTLRINSADFDDWVHFTAWKENGQLRRKPGANLISSVTQTGSGHIAINPGCAIPVSYAAEGDQPAAENSRTGLWGNVINNAFTFSVPADTTERELNVYVGVTNGGRGEFNATLSDGSAPAFTDATWNANRSNDWCPVPDEAAICYTLRYRAASPGQTLTVAWKLIGDPNRYRAQIRLQAATLRTITK